ncbi:hypothetical protein BGZ67_006252 [Mortierella alpina]|nr:hypothetical protein BGZ67_006252 [Mortierella alpina]
MIASVPQSGSDERQPLLGRSQDPSTEQGSWFYRARRAPVAVACVVAMALFTDMVVYGVVVPILPIIVKERLGGSSSDVGLLFACYAIGLLASTPFFAIMSDKYQNRRIPMMVGMLGLAVATVGFSLASNYWVLILARIGQGSAGGASWTIGLGMLADVYPPNNLGVVMGATMMANSIGFMLGPVVGAYFYEYHGYNAPFIFCAGLATLDFLCIVFLAEPEKKKHPVSASATSATTDLGLEEAGESSTGASKRRQQVMDEDVDNLSIEEAPTTSTIVAVERTVAAISDPKHAQEILDDGLHHHHHPHPHPSTHKHQQDDDANNTSANRVSHETGYGSIPEGSSSSSSASSLSSESAPSSVDSDPTPEEKEGEEACRDVSMLEIASNWTIICCLLATFVAASVFSGLEPILPLYLKDSLEAGPLETGLILIAAICPTLLSSAIGYAADRVGHFYVSLAGMVIFAIGTFALCLPRSLLLFILPLALFGFGSSMILTPLLPAMADAVNKNGWNCYAKTYALYNMTYSLSMAAGPILAGFIYDDFGFPWTMAMFGFMIVLATPVIFGPQITHVMAKWRRGSVFARS